MVSTNLKPFGYSAKFLVFLFFLTCVLAFGVSSSALAISSAISSTGADSFYSFESASMGTRFRLTLSAPDEVTAHQRFDECRALLNSLENEWSPWIEGSDVWRINNAGAGRVDVSPHTYDLISRSLTVSELTRGAFDITFASVGHLYRYREHVRPSDTARKDALTKVSYKNLKLEPNHQLVLLKDGIRVDLGGVAKGESIEQLKALLLSKGIRSAYFSLGGDSYVLGKKGEYPWMLGIKHPRKEKEVIARIPLENIAVSTSGDYERFFMDEGKRVHHILSPVSGLPADEVMSVTVMGPDAWKTDALSTSVFIMGIKPGIQLIESLSGYDVIVVDKTGQIFASKGLVSPSNPK